MWCTAVHVGVDRAGHSRRVLLPDSFLSSSTTSTSTPTLNTYTVNPSQCNTPPAHTHTHTQTSTHTFHSASCGDRLGCLQQWPCHTLMYSSTHSNWRSRALKFSLWPANSCSPGATFSFFFFSSRHQCGRASSLKTSKKQTFLLFFLYLKIKKIDATRLRAICFKV